MNWPFWRSWFLNRAVASIKLRMSWPLAVLRVEISLLFIWHRRLELIPRIFAARFGRTHRITGVEHSASVWLLGFPVMCGWNWKTIFCGSVSRRFVRFEVGAVLVEFDAVVDFLKFGKVRRVVWHSAVSSIVSIIVSACNFNFLIVFGEMISLGRYNVKIPNVIWNLGSWIRLSSIGPILH